MTRDAERMSSTLRSDLSNPVSQLSSVALWLFAYCAASSVVSIAAGWPAQFGGAGDPSNVAEEFLSRGTATAPPLIPLLLLGATAVLARVQRAPAFTSVALVVMGALFVIGSVGEIRAPEPVTTPRGVLIAGGVIAGGWGLLLVWRGLVVLRAVAQARSLR